MSESRCGHHRYQHSTKSLKTARQKILPSPGAVCRLAKSARGHPLALMKNARSVFRAVLPGYLYSADWMTHPAPASSQPSGHQFYFLFSPP
ncbi:hypothetical protein PGT21_008220 [Puccinia graminis f. sp. tritici]|nr:hypothetical protein PGT21_008220 [Puccinia graminis f. sp. tritici]